MKDEKLSSETCSSLSQGDGDARKPQEVIEMMTSLSQPQPTKQLDFAVLSVIPKNYREN